MLLCRRLFVQYAKIVHPESEACLGGTLQHVATIRHRQSDGACAARCKQQRFSSRETIAGAYASSAFLARNTAQQTAKTLQSGPTIPGSICHKHAVRLTVGPGTFVTGLKYHSKLRAKRLLHSIPRKAKSDDPPEPGQDGTANPLQGLPVSTPNQGSSTLRPERPPAPQHPPRQALTPASNAEQLPTTSAAATGGTTGELPPGVQRGLQRYQRLYGTACILLVAILWGSYAPALKYAYTLPGGPSPLVLTALRGVLQCSLLFAANLLLLPPRAQPGLPGQESKYFSEQQGEGQQQQQQQQPPYLMPGQQREGRGQQLEPRGQGGDDPGWVPGKGKQANMDGNASGGWQRARDSNEAGGGLGGWAAAVSPAVLGGLEIGLYNTLGTTSQAVGLAYTTATRSAFLVQSAAIFTPVLAATAGSPPTRPLWLGSMLALLGAMLVAAEGAGGGGGQGAGDSASLWLLGDALTVFAALCYSQATVRIAVYAQQVHPLRLALGKSVMLALVSFGLLAWQIASMALHGDLASASLAGALAQLWPNYRDPLGWAVIAYTAIGPGALSAYLQVKGQGMVPPTEAQILFSSVPLWSVLFAALVLQEEAGGLLTWVGGGAMVAAGLVAAL